MDFFKNIRELFVFTRQEKKGILVLLCILFILILVNIFSPYLYRSKTPDISAWENEIDKYLDSLDRPSDHKLISFDPNQTDSGKLVLMGVPSKVAGYWGKYLKKGGRFKVKEDVKRIYGMTAELFDRLNSFLEIPVKETRKVAFTQRDSVSGRVVWALNKIPEKKNYTPAERNYTPVDLNEADSARLENLPGIGPVLASRIIKFREKLGGFYSVSQLQEVYGLRPEHFVSASPHLFVGEGNIKKFNINFSTIAELGRHPYIGYRKARNIIMLRDRRGKIRSAGELTIMGEDSLKKLMPYLVFDE